jgi:zinc protease
MRQGDRRAVHADSVRFDFEERFLDNGLRVILHRDRSTPVVAVHLMYHVGSKNERRGRTGFAHLFEHLLFQGSGHVPKGEHFRMIQRAGGTLNGSTWFDRTNYFEVLPSNELDLALWLESDRMGFFDEAITQEKLDNQRGVVKNERRQSYENRPYGLAFETLLAHAYPEGHPYRHPTIGYMEDLDEASLEDVHAFFRSYYAPNNAVLVLAGDIDPEDALDRARAYFGEFPARPVPAPPAVHRVGDERGERRAVLGDAVQVPRVYMLFHAPSFNDPDFEASDVLTGVLAEGKSSRLHRKLVYERQVAAEVQCFTWPLESVGMLIVVATARPGIAAADLEAEVLDVLGPVSESGASEDELTGARNRARRALVRRLNSVGDRADAFADAVILRDDPEYVNRAFDRYEAVCRDDVARVASTVLRPARRTVLHVVPEGADAEGRAA